MVGRVFSEGFLAHVLVAFFPVKAAEPATFIAQEFDLLLLGIRKCVQLVELLVQPEIGNDVAEFFAIQLCLELFEIGNDFCR